MIVQYASVIRITDRLSFINLNESFKFTLLSKKYHTYNMAN